VDQLASLATGGLSLWCRAQCWWYDGEKCGRVSVQCCDEGKCESSLLIGHECREGHLIC
jgi:hypothetical protein